MCFSRSVSVGLWLLITAAALGSDPETLLVIEPSREHPRNSEGDIIELKDGSLLLAYTRFTGGSRDDSRADICARTSRDGGKTWSADRMLIRCEGKDNIMSVSLLRLPKGEILLFYLRKDAWDDCRLYVRRSRDEVASLSKPTLVTVAPGYYVVNNARVLLTSDATLVAPHAYHPCPDGTPKTWQQGAIPRAFISKDGGHTWRADATVVEPLPKMPVVLQEPGVLELRDGRLWMYHRTNAGFQYCSFSADGGLHWSTPEPTSLASPLSPATIKRVPWTGDLMAVWNDHSGSRAALKERRSPLSVALSSDDGRTWGRSRDIETDPKGWYCYTSVTFVGNRAILSYCAGDDQVGGLNRLKVIALPREWLYPAAASAPEP